MDDFDWSDWDNQASEYLDWSGQMGPSTYDFGDLNSYTDLNNYDWGNWDQQASEYLDASGLMGPSVYDFSGLGLDPTSLYTGSSLYGGNVNFDTQRNLMFNPTEQEIIDYVTTRDDLDMPDKIALLQDYKSMLGFVEPDAYSKDSPVVSPDDQYKSAATVFKESGGGSGGAGGKSPWEKIKEMMGDQALKQMTAKQNFANSPLGAAASAAQAAGLLAQAIVGKPQAKVTARESTVQDTGPKFSGTGAPRTLFAKGGQVKGGLLPITEKILEHVMNQKGLIGGDDGGQEDVVDISAAPGEYVIDAEVVSMLGDGNTEAGAKKLDKMRYNIRKHKRSGGLSQIASKSKDPEQYLKGK